MESSKQFFCHTCKRTFNKVVLSEDDEVTCNTCGEYFVELIEDSPHLQQLFNIYKEETKENANAQTQQQANQPDQQWLNNLQGNIEEIMRNHGETRTVNSNGQDINVTTVHRQAGNTSISIANIDNLHNFAHIDIQQEINEDDLEDGGDQGQNPDLEQVINLEIQIDDQPDLNQNQPQPQPNQQQPGPQQNDPFNIQGLLNGLFGGAQPQGVQVIHQVINNGVPLVQNIIGNLQNNPQQQQQQQQPFPNMFNLFGGNNLFGGAPLFGGAQLEQNILNQVLEQSIQQALNQQHGIPTSKKFIQNMKPIKGSQLVQKEDCQVCFDAFTDEDTLYKLPCNHKFHEACIMPWLEKHNTCPSCRKELPTDDINYENRKKQTPNDPSQQFQNNNNNNGGNSGSGGSTFNSSYHA